MAGSVHRYGTGVKYGTDHRFGETAESFTAETASSISYFLGGGFGSGLLGGGVFGAGDDGAATVTYSSESASSPSYVAE